MEGGDDCAWARFVAPCIEEGLLEEVYCFCCFSGCFFLVFPEADGEVDVEVAEMVGVERCISL